MGYPTKTVKLVLVTDRSNCSSLLHYTLDQAGVAADIRTLPPGDSAVNCVQQRGPYHRNALPDLFIFDFTHPDEQTTTVLRRVAFGAEKSAVPMILLTSPESLRQLDDGHVDGGDAVMFSPTSLVSFARKMQLANRTRFFNALQTLYQFGPILVRAPQAMLRQDRHELKQSA